MTPAFINDQLLECGYRPDMLQADFRFGDGQTVPLVGFAHPPMDSRSACVAVISGSDTTRLAVEGCRPLGAPLVFVCFKDHLQWWKQGARSAEYLESVGETDINRFFQSRIDSFAPEAVYRAKTWGRFQSVYQLEFVDLGLMPVVEEQVGKALGRLIERNVSEVKGRLRWEEVTVEQGHWLLQTVFWLVSAKILRDKQVESFLDLDLGDVAEVFRRVGLHYGTKPLAAGSADRLEALSKAAHEIGQFSSLVLTTTEALAYVYENTLISKKTRSALGTHSTPSYLVDYVVGNLADWIREIPVDKRTVFEPACGHAAFLVSAMRLLTEILPSEKKVPSWRGPYLRSSLHGTDIDPFALELARLSLTLTDIPIPDGWDLKPQDMFLEDRLSLAAQKNMILLANPPFGDFTPEEKRICQERSSPVRFSNKSAEMLWRTLPQLPHDAVFGVVVPQTILHSDNARELREFLVNDCELKEICLFPDNVFSFSGAESAVLVGRRQRVSGESRVGYGRIRERELPLFRSDYFVPGYRSVPQSRFRIESSYSLRLRELEEVWSACASYPVLNDMADLAKGLDYRGQLPGGSITYSRQRFHSGQPGFIRFIRGLQLHELPTVYWMNLDPSVISSARSGTTVGTPQVLLNYARASRGPWRLKALLDKEGHAVTSRFIPVRPKDPAYSIEALWALLNSPVANAYAYSYLGKRDNLVGDIRRIPMPKRRSFEAVERAVNAYLAAASSDEAPAPLEALLKLVDAEVLKLYALPLELEQRVLGLFSGWKRVGVPFVQTGYLPEELDNSMSFSEFIQLEEDWPSTNRERGLLIERAC